MPSPTAKVRSNVLHDYANYTYNLQLYAITQAGFNKISQGAIAIGRENDIVSDGSLLISNGGVGNGETRASEFPTDFVIDNLEIETVIGGKGPGARGTDAIRITFDIIEPYTVTLLNRLVKLAANSKFGKQKDFKSLIYCLKISFLGYDDLGRPVTIPNSTKYFPFSLINATFNISSKGAVYKCEGIAMQNVTLTSLDNVVPFHVELKGQTIKDLFNGVVMSSSSNTARTDQVPNNNSTTVTRGIGQALNDNEKWKTENNYQTISNEYVFKFEDSLLNASVQSPRLPEGVIAMPTTQGADGQNNRQQSRIGSLTLDTASRTFKAQAGTKITDLINSVMLTTDFMKNQVADVGQTPSQSKPFTWIKITPLLELKDYDPKTKYYARKITYSVKTYEYYGEDHEKINQQTLPVDAVVKNYEYIFTGNNKDVYRANLDYKIAFFDPRNAAKYNTANRGGDTPGPESAESQNRSNDNDNRWAKAGHQLTNGLPGMENGEVSRDIKSMTLAEQVTKLFDNGVDLLSLDIEIVGDPDWIQQDNILYGTNVPKNQKTLTNGTINFQDSVTCFNFTFKSPTKDYDDVTGLIPIDETAIFSGTYQVITVKSRFARGKFTQTLQNVRLRNQDSDRAAQNQTSVRTDTAGSSLTKTNNLAVNNTNTTTIVVG
jgi:hypothetical protein